MPRYLFNVQLVGEGKTLDDAWNDAIEAIGLDAGPVPDDFKVISNPCMFCGIDENSDEPHESIFCERYHAPTFIK